MLMRPIREPLAESVIGAMRPSEFRADASRRCRLVSHSGTDWGASGMGSRLIASSQERRPTSTILRGSQNVDEAGSQASAKRDANVE